MLFRSQDLFPSHDTPPLSPEKKNTTAPSITEPVTTNPTTNTNTNTNTTPKQEADSVILETNPGYKQLADILGKDNPLVKLYTERQLTLLNKIRNREENVTNEWFDSKINIFKALLTDSVLKEKDFINRYPSLAPYYEQDSAVNPSELFNFLS